MITLGVTLTIGFSRMTLAPAVLAAHMKRKSIPFIRRWHSSGSRKSACSHRILGCENVGLLVCRTPHTKAPAVNRRLAMAPPRKPLAPATKQVRPLNTADPLTAMRGVTYRQYSDVEHQPPVLPLTRTVICITIMPVGQATSFHSNSNSTECCLVGPHSSPGVVTRPFVAAHSRDSIRRENCLESDQPMAGLICSSASWRLRQFYQPASTRRGEHRNRTHDNSCRRHLRRST